MLLHKIIITILLIILTIVIIFSCKVELNKQIIEKNNNDKNKYMAYMSVFNLILSNNGSDLYFIKTDNDNINAFWEKSSNKMPNILISPGELNSDGYFRIKNKIVLNINLKMKNVQDNVYCFEVKISSGTMSSETSEYYIFSHDGNIFLKEIKLLLVS